MLAERSHTGRSGGLLRRENAGMSREIEVRKMCIRDRLERRARLKDVTIFFLEVRQSNEAAKRLYEKLGYSPIGVRTVSYTHLEYIRMPRYLEYKY